MKKIVGNPWVLMVAGVIALAAYARFDSPLAMAVIGLPFFIVIVGGAMLGRYARSIAPARQPSGAGQRTINAVAIGLIVAGFGYIVWSRINDNGFVGWIDSVQAQNDGKYDAKLSLITAMFDLMIVIGVVVGLITLVRRPAASASPAGPAIMPPRPSVNAAVAQRKTVGSPTRVLLFTMLAIAVATWVGGFGAYEYYTDRNRQEMQATYEPIDVSQTAAATRPAFVALRGRPHPLGSLSLKTEHETDGTYFVPLVAPPGRDRDAPVHWVVQLHGSYLPPLPLPLRAHDVGGTLSQTTRDAFARMGVRLAPDVVLVSYVPVSSDGVVLDSSAENWNFFMLGAGFVSATCVLIFFFSWIALGVRSRRARLRQPPRQSS